MGNVLGIVMVVTIVSIRDYDNVVFTAIICNLAAIAMVLVVALVVTDGSKVMNHCPSSVDSLGQ